MTEGDASGHGQRQSGALFAADHFMTWLGNGASHVNWWNLHNGLSVERNNYGDQGILSSGHARLGISQPPANTPFPPYYGVQLVSQFMKVGDTFVDCVSDRSKLVAHAVRHGSGKVGVLLINQDPDHDALVTVKGGVDGPRESFLYQRGWSAVKRTPLKRDAQGRVRVPAYGIVAVP